MEKLTLLAAQSVTNVLDDTLRSLHFLQTFPLNQDNEPLLALQKYQSKNSDGVGNEALSSLISKQWQREEQLKNSNDNSHHHHQIAVRDGIEELCQFLSDQRGRNDDEQQQQQQQQLLDKLFTITNQGLTPSSSSSSSQQKKRHLNPIPNTSLLRAWDLFRKITFETLATTIQKKRTTTDEYEKINERLTQYATETKDVARTARTQRKDYQRTIQQLERRRDDDLTNDIRVATTAQTNDRTALERHRDEMYAASLSPHLHTVADLVERAGQLHKEWRVLCE
eukprot:CAMPEP_0172492450 /NCGR_PEP_ID=MMETSP1066-20121228/23617_1 /TAXON_ID=671091 /ORGANISM="Coscinodiscus wailesii, Strain CCMP2513" /LENGTH=280 /DNA_ID=CAMNT_0013262097 /DNA_START=89 /DNA_END=928 /DNA_ORIENTATION=+